MAAPILFFGHPEVPIIALPAGGCRASHHRNASASIAGNIADERLPDVLVGEETDLPYERPPLSRGYLMGKEPREKAYVRKAPVVSRQQRRTRPGRPGGTARSEGAHGDPRRRAAAAL